MLGRSFGRPIQCIQRRDPGRSAADPKGNALPPELGNQRVGHFGAGRYRRGLLHRSDRTPRPTDSVSHSVLVGQEASGQIDRVLDAESLCALGGAPAA